jgi:hypothetical protein
MTGRERLRLLHDQLLTDTNHFLDMNQWMNATDEEILNSYCGTVCCAFGFACTIPELQKEGLYLREQYCTREGVKSLSPRYFHYADFTAARVFFQLSQSKVSYIFKQETYAQEHPTKADVCKRIMEVLSEDREEA